MEDVFNAVRDTLSKEALLEAGDIGMRKRRKKRRKTIKTDADTTRTEGQEEQEESEAELPTVTPCQKDSMQQNSDK